MGTVSRRITGFHDTRGSYRDRLCSPSLQNSLVLPKDIFPAFARFPRLRHIHDFQEMIHINPSGKDTCMHITIRDRHPDTRLLAARLPPQQPLADAHQPLRKAAGLRYSSLCENQEEFDMFPKKTVDMAQSTSRPC
jgi:hypothetical protein